MSKNRNRARANKAKNRQEYLILTKNFDTYCPICSKRTGDFKAYCGPTSNKLNKSWKSYRKFQYK